MRIDHLYFENFRNLSNQHVIPAAGINVLWGANGQGKTNLLEGIYLFAYLKSFRGAGNSDLIKSQSNEAKISATVNSFQVSRQIDLKINKRGRNFFLDGKKPRPIESLLDALRAILFAPDELFPLRTLPSARRNLLDRGIFQLQPSYLMGAINYDRVLKQRNRLLHDRASEEMIRPWTEQLIVAGAKIRHSRNLFIEELQPHLKKNHEFLSGEEEVVAMLYPVCAGSLEEHENLLAIELQSVKSRETRIGLTCAGPHRDDLLFELNGNSVRYIASQGQWRTLILSFKMAQMRLLYERIGVWPILLFDDMSAELDNARQERLFSLLSDCKAQVFITTTDPQPFFRYGKTDIHTFQMTAGEITPGESCD